MLRFLNHAQALDFILLSYSKMAFTSIANTQLGYFVPFGVFMDK